MVLVVVATTVYSFAEMSAIDQLDSRVDTLSDRLNSVEDRFEKWLSAVFAPFRSFVEGAISNVQGRLAALEATVFGRLDPFVKGLSDVVNTVQTAVAVANGRIDQVVNDVYGRLFPGLDRLEGNIRQLFGDLERLAAQFDAKLAGKIQALEDKLLANTTGRLSALRDELLDRIHEATDPITRRINGVVGAFDRVLDGVHGRLRGIEGLLGEAFDSPITLTRRAVEATAGRWGNELFEAVIGKATDAPGPADMDYIRKPHEEPLTERAALLVSRSREWLDLEQYLNWWRKQLFQPEPVDAQRAPALKLEGAEVPELTGLTEEQLQQELRRPSPETRPVLLPPPSPPGLPRFPL